MYRIYTNQILASCPVSSSAGLVGTGGGAVTFVKLYLPPSSLCSKRFCGFSEQRKTIFDNLAAREMGASEKMGGGGKNYRAKKSALKTHRNACYVGYPPS